MITLALLRHAKAVKDDPGGDHARGLSNGGRAEAAAAGEWLRGNLLGSVLVLASDARRTRETAELAFPLPRAHTELRLEADLYGASAADLLKVIRNLKTEAAVVLVGHNPGISEAARRLAGSGETEVVARLQEGLPTSAAALLSFDGGWADVAPGSGRLSRLFLGNREG